MTTTDPRTILAEIKARADAATEGPWVSHDLSDTVFNSENDAGWWWVWQESKLPYYGGVLGPDAHGSTDGSIGEASITDARDGHQEKADAEFIAHARTDLPDMAAALTAVLDLHKPQTIGQIYGTLKYPSDPLLCPTCIVTGGDEWGFMEYPCPTVRAITSALGGDRE